MIIKIKEKLTGNEDLLHSVLEKIGCTHIKQFINNEGLNFKFGFDMDSSGGSNVINIESLKFHSFSRDISGDILTLVSTKLNITLGETIKWLADYLGLKFKCTKREI